jgi:hypothetical protein
MKASEIKSYQSKSYTALERLAVKWFNSFIRKRDSQEIAGGFICISCRELKPINKMTAGHFFAAGHYPILRFDEDNVHGQCQRCNMHLHGNLLHYREALLAKIGILQLTIIEDKSKIRGCRTDRWRLIEIIIQYKTKTNQYAKNQNSTPSTSNPSTGIKRRMHFQQKIDR